MVSEKERITRWQAERRRRRAEEYKKNAERPYSSMFAVTQEDLAESKELEEYLLLQNLNKANRQRRMTTGELKLALAAWGLEELRQLWSMRQDKLTYVEDAALLLSHMRHRSGIDSQFKPTAELMTHDAILALKGTLEELGSSSVEEIDGGQSVPVSAADGKRAEQVLRVIREGQADFRKRLITHYGPVCMVTGMAVPAVIDAAHIIPYGGPATNSLSNGLLLRKDIHALFDAGLLSIGPDLVIYIGAGVEDSYYRSLDGQPLRLESSSKISESALRRRISGDETSELDADIPPAT